MNGKIELPACSERGKCAEGEVPRDGARIRAVFAGMRGGLEKEHGGEGTRMEIPPPKRTVIMKYFYHIQAI